MSLYLIDLMTEIEFISEILIKFRKKNLFMASIYKVNHTLFDYYIKFDCYIEENPNFHKDLAIVSKLIFIQISQ